MKEEHRCPGDLSGIAIPRKNRAIKMQGLYLRNAVEEDARLLLDWRNESSVRQNSFSADIIEYEDHIKWLRRKLADENEKLLILMRDEILVGQIRLSNDGHEVEISYSIDKKYRGMGYGKAIIRMAENVLREEHYLGKVVGLVKKENEASKKVFLSLGYSETEEDGFFRYEKILQSMMFFRVDMNPTIATGHMMRCLSIADEVRELGGDVTFIAADECPLELCNSRGYDVIVLHSDWKDMESELPKLTEVIELNQIEELFVDSYQVTPEYLSGLQKSVKVTYLDDLDKFDYPVDRIVCYANYCKMFSYAKENSNRHCLGMEYIPLRKVFRECPEKKIADRIRKVLLLSGGTDSYGIIEKMVECFKNVNSIMFVTVCGRYYEGFEELQDKYREYSNLEFYKNVSDLETYMKEADLAISAGGTTLYELCAVGTPTISYSFADNQLYNVKQFDEDGIIEYAGDVRSADIFENVWNYYLKYNADIKLRRDKSIKMQRMVDGKGASRIASVLLGLNE